MPIFLQDLLARLGLGPDGLPVVGTGGSGGGGGGGGGLGSFVQPSFQYLAPDREEVKQVIKATLVAMVGIADEARLNALTDLYMKADRDRAMERHRLGTEAARTDFETQKRMIDDGSYARGEFVEGKFIEGTDINPIETVRNRIRGFNDYQAAHNLRPDYIDEMQWIGTQQQAAVSAGGRLSETAQQGINFATVGANPAQVGEAVGFQESITQQRTLPSFFRSLERVASVARGLL